MNGFLVLEDGTVFEGESVAAQGCAFGEVVFTTSMTGYQEIVTDPSYAEQLVCFTAPMVGNYGVSPTRSESTSAHARHEKEVPWEAAPFGVTGLETAFPVLYTHLVDPGRVPLETLLERMSAGPARIYGLDEPAIAVGATANIVLIDPEAEWTVEERGFRSRSANSWLLGQRLRSRILLTIAAGRVAFG